MKPAYTNKKGTANAQILDSQIAKNKGGKDDLNKKINTAKDIIKKTAEENANIKPTKNYLDSDLAKKPVKEEFLKPEFKNFKAKETEGEHFAEIDKSKSEDVRNFHY